MFSLVLGHMLSNTMKPAESPTQMRISDHIILSRYTCKNLLPYVVGVVRPFFYCNRSSEKTVVPPGELEYSILKGLFSDTTNSPTVVADV